MKKTEGGQTLPQIVIIIDELADLMMMAKNEVEESVIRIAQKGRHDQLLMEDGLYRELYSMQLKDQKENDVPSYESDDLEDIMPS
jgi:ABC-type multidrug transport system fused ATPase/permease subunit